MGKTACCIGGSQILGSLSRISEAALSLTKVTWGALATLEAQVSRPFRLCVTTVKTSKAAEHGREWSTWRVLIL